MEVKVYPANDAVYVIRLLTINHQLMIILLSPSKSLKKSKCPVGVDSTMPVFIDKSAALVKVLQKYSPVDLMDLMGVSRAIASLNVDRFALWSKLFSVENSHPAILFFSGDVYAGLNAADFTASELGYAQQHIRVLSGLYGMLRPLDLMQPYRLEMGTAIGVGKAKNLYQYWKIPVADELNSLLSQSADRVIVNLASQEYFKAVDTDTLNGRIVNIEFREMRPDGLKIIAIYAKKARGLMARFAVKNGIADVEQLKLFDLEGYAYSDNNSTPNKWVFVR